MAKETVRVTFLGGLGEIGRNCLALEQDGRIVVVDAGLMFPEPTMYGVDIILPDFRWLIERRDRVDGIVLTHGHEDHTGALRYLVKDVNVPIYGSALTLGFARHRLTEAKVAHDLEFVEVADLERRRIGPFEVEFIPGDPLGAERATRWRFTPRSASSCTRGTSNSTSPRSTGVAPTWRGWRRLVTRAWRCCFVTRRTPRSRVSPRRSASVGGALRRLFLERPERRMVVACFASHIHRVQQIINVALEQKRKIVLMGRSMEANVKLARKLNLLHVNTADLVDVENIDRFSPGEICVICTGSQGEPLAALSKLSRGDARFMKVGPDDTVILSSHPIPGNEWSVGRVIDDLHRAGTEVIHSGNEPVHASGHARQGELRTFHQLVRPRNFVPVHGEYRHMVHHADLALTMGLKNNHVLICEDGDQVEVSATGIRRSGQVPAGFHYIDGSAGDLDERPLEERRMLAEYGLLLISGGVDKDRGVIVEPIKVTTRGWFEGERDAELLEKLTSSVRESLDVALREGDRDAVSLNKVAQRSAGRLLGQKYRRQPVLLAAIAVF